MIKKNEEQFDSGGVILKHTFLLGFNDLKIPTEDITEDMVDAYVKEKSLDFEWEFKSFLMMELGYIGKEGDVWIKEPVVTCSVCETPIHLKDNVVHNLKGEPCHKICFKEHYT